jgi:hypothetical protein
MEKIPCFDPIATPFADYFVACDPLDFLYWNIDSADSSSIHLPVTDRYRYVDQMQRCVDSSRSFSTAAIGLVAAPRPCCS